MPTTGYIPPRNLTNPGPFSKGAKKIAQDENFLFGITGEEKVGMNTFYFKFRDETAEPVEIWNTMRNINWPQLRQITKATDGRYAPSETSDISLLWDRMQKVLNWPTSQKLNSIFAFEGRHVWLRIQMRYRQKAGGRVDKVSGAFNLPLFGFLGPAWRVNKTTGKGEYAGGSTLQAGWYYARTAGRPTLITSIDDLLRTIEEVASQHRRGDREGYRVTEAKGETDANNAEEAWANGIIQRINTVHDTIQNSVDSNYYADDASFLPFKGEEGQDAYQNAIAQIEDIEKDLDGKIDLLRDIGDSSTAGAYRNAYSALDRVARELPKLVTKNAIQETFSGMSVPGVDKRKFTVALTDLQNVAKLVSDAASVFADYEYEKPVPTQDAGMLREEQINKDNAAADELAKWDDQVINECGIHNFLDCCNDLRTDLAGSRCECSFGTSNTDLADKCREMAQTLLAIADNIDRGC